MRCTNNAIRSKVSNLTASALLGAGMATGFLSGAFAHDTQAPKEPVGLEELADMFGVDFDAIPIKTQKIKDGLHVLFGFGGNIAVSSGEDGILIVDDQFPQLMPKIKDALKEIASDKVDIVVNTHGHFDHAEGNLTLGKEDTQIVSHKNAREMQRTGTLINLAGIGVIYDQQAYPAHALPDVTYEKSMSFYFNGEEVSLLHYGAAHTDGDTVVIFRGQNAVHMGDVFHNAAYPFVDASNGGEIDGVIATCENVLAQIDDDTVVIPGHGPVADKARFARYIEILKITRGRIAALVDEGKSMEEIMAAAPTAEFDKEIGGDESGVRGYIDRVYTNLTSE